MTSGISSGVGDSSSDQLRILAVSYTWQGANDYAFVRAFRRLGHSVRTVSPDQFNPDWRSMPLRILRRLLSARIADEFNAALLREVREFRPELLFVFKGSMVRAESLREIRALGVIAIQFYPDVSFRTHGPWLPDALREYDWVFTTKSFGLRDMETQLGVTASSLLPHAYDPETHRLQSLSAVDRERYACDISFIGQWTPGKEKLLKAVHEYFPGRDMRIWGYSNWLGRHPAYQHRPLFGLEFAKAIALSRINIGLLSEQQPGASDGDQITARTFEIPASGGFLLHQRTDEAQALFAEDQEFACFADEQELVEKIGYYLDHEEERSTIARKGYDRCVTSGYSTDNRVASILAKYEELRLS